MSKRLLSTIFVIIVGIGSLFLLQGCDKEETLTPQDFAPPTNLRALSQSGAVVLYWTRSTADGVADFAGYRVQTFNSLNVKIDSFQTTNDTARITTGMVNGSNYSFSVRAVKSNGDVSIPDSIQWGPTMRHALAVRIYEYASANPSGLQFSSGNSFPFNYDNNASNIDLWIDGRSNTDPLLKSPDDFDVRPNWRTTRFFETSVTSLDEQVNFPAASSFRSTPGLTIVPGRVYLAITDDGNYVRFQSSGVAGTSPDRYVDITIAYNTGTGDWAKK